MEYLFSLPLRNRHLIVSRRLVTNSSDRTLRQFILPSYTNYANSIPPTTDSDHQSQFLDLELEPTHRFNDPINKTSWHAMCYSPDGEWLAGGRRTFFDSHVCFLSHTINQVQQIQQVTKFISGISLMTVSLRALWMVGENRWCIFM